MSEVLYKLMEEIEQECWAEGYFPEIDELEEMAMYQLKGQNND